MTKPLSQSKKKIRKWPFILLGVIAFLAAITWLSYKNIIAYAISNAIVKDSTPSILLGPYGTEVHKFKTPINRAAEQIIYKLDSLHIPFETFLSAIDNADKNEILMTLQELKHRQPKSPNEVFNIVKQNMTVKEFDPEILRKPFLKHVTMEKIDKALNYIEMHNLAREIDVSISREIIKKILIQKKEDIAYRLKTSGGISTD